MRARQTRPSRLARPGQLPAAHRPTSAQSRQTNSEPWATPFSQTPAVERITLEPSRANTGRTKGSIGLRGRCEVASGRCEVGRGSVRGVRADFADGAKGAWQLFRNRSVPSRWLTSPALT